ncbi:MAG TPA: PaaX family transcriptional regulator C-terminal domain-containing protein [Nocardioidaceae bacterium]|nr:PaaX family transcriptional regulator C-terminal domain-containing protein [Nocardioidaceae bacterium]
MTDRSAERVAAPRALIVTIYGLYARERGGWISVAALIRLLAELGVDEPAVRSSISRLKRRGLLAADRIDGVAGYGLTSTSRGVLDEGDRRIFDRARARLDDGWLVAVFSVPETHRQHRHALRSRLSWLGFGTVAAGVWIAPAHLEAETRDVLERDGLAPYVDLFGADYRAFGDVRDKVSRWWDLDGLQALYDEFLTEYGPVLAAWRRRRTSGDAEAFGDWVQALTAWRRLPYLDPGLPAELLPRDWHGIRAAELFEALRGRLADPAKRHAASAL